MDHQKEPYFDIDSFIKKMREYRDSKGILYIWKHFSRDSGVSEYMIKSIICNRKEPGLMNIIKICNFIGENIYDFIEYTEDKTFIPITSK